jgi:hypothetical protein
MIVAHNTLQGTWLPTRDSGCPARRSILALWLRLSAFRYCRHNEFFVYHASDRAALEGALERYHDGAPIEPTTWIRATAKDVGLIRQLGVRETGMLASASDYHTFHKLESGEFCG